MTTSEPTDVPPRLGWTVLYVDDVSSLVEFWERAFALPARCMHESTLYTELETGAAALALCARSLARESTGLDLAPAPMPAGNVTLVVADVPAAYKQALAVDAGLGVELTPGAGRQAELLTEEGTRRLRHTRAAPESRTYVVLSDAIVADDERLLTWLRAGVETVVTQTRSEG